MSRRPAQHLVVYEPFRSIFYAPQFVTLYGGHFAAEGFDVEVRTAGGGVTSAGALVDGAAKVSLGGVMVTMAESPSWMFLPFLQLAIGYRPSAIDPEAR